jgi:hypothetical protein
VSERTLAARQAQTRTARQTFSNSFNSPESRTAYFRDLGRRSAERRVTLSAEQAEAVAAAYQLLGSIASKLPTSEPNDDAAPDASEAA